VDHKTVDQASFGNTQDQDVEQSAMFEDMNQTQMTFPPNNNLNKADKNQLKIKQLA